MMKHVLLLSLLVGVAQPALAGNRVFVASTGNDANACTQAAPCATFNKAITTAGANGAIVCLDRGTYLNSDLSVTASLGILCGRGLGDLGSYRLTIATAASDDVVLQGLVSDRASAVGSPVLFTGAGSLHVRDAILRNTFVASVNFLPTGPGTLFVTDSIFDTNFGSGLSVVPSPGGYANVHVRNVKMMNGRQDGLYVDGSNSLTGININVVDSAFLGNGDHGVIAFSGLNNPGQLCSPFCGNAPVNISIMGSQITGNLNRGIEVNTALAALRIGKSMIVANKIGLSPGSGGQIISLGGNHVHSNSINGSFSSSLPTQ